MSSPDAKDRLTAAMPCAPPDSLNPAMVAMVSSSVDLLDPFSPTMIAIAFSKDRSKAPLATIGRENG